MPFFVQTFESHQEHKNSWWAGHAGSRRTLKDFSSCHRDATFLQKRRLQKKATCRFNTDVGISKNRDTPKWMVYNGNPYQNGWFGGTIIFGNIHVLIVDYIVCFFFRDAGDACEKTCTIICIIGGNCCRTQKQVSELKKVPFQKIGLVDSFADFLQRWWVASFSAFLH